MSKPEVMVESKYSLRHQEDETLRGTSHLREPILIWVIVGSVITNNFTSLTVYYEVTCVKPNSSMSIITILNLGFLYQLFNNGDYFLKSLVYGYPRKNIHSYL